MAAARRVQVAGVGKTRTEELRKKRDKEQRRTVITEVRLLGKVLQGAARLDQRLQVVDCQAGGHRERVTGASRAFAIRKLLIAAACDTGIQLYRCHKPLLFEFGRTCRCCRVAYFVEPVRFCYFAKSEKSQNTTFSFLTSTCCCIALSFYGCSRFRILLHVRLVRTWPAPTAGSSTYDLRVRSFCTAWHVDNAVHVDPRPDLLLLRLGCLGRAPRLSESFRRVRLPCSMFPCTTTPQAQAAPPVFSIRRPRRQSHSAPVTADRACA
jgi:hypothetical protein